MKYPIEILLNTPVADWNNTAVKHDFRQLYVSIDSKVAELTDWSIQSSTQENETITIVAWCLSSELFEIGHMGQVFFEAQATELGYMLVAKKAKPVETIQEWRTFLKEHI